MAVASFAQAGADLKGAKKSKNVASALDTGGGIDGFNFDSFNSADNLLDNYEQLLNPAGLESAIAEGEASLAELGYDYNEETGQIDTPSGGVSPSSLGSAQSLAEAGLISNAEAVASDQFAKKVANKFSVVKLGVKSGGGGSGGSYRRTASYDSELPDYSKLFGSKSRKPQAAKTAGLSKSIGGESIGVSIDNIFKMVHRSYGKMRDNRDFINE